MKRATTALILGAAGLGLAVLDASIKPPVRPRKRRELSGMSVDETDEAPPPGLQFDDRAPCNIPVPETPWSVQPNPADFVVDQQGRALSVAGGPLVLNPDNDTAYCIPPADLEPKPRTSRPLAKGGPRPLWPIRTKIEKKVRVSYQDIRDKFHGKWGSHFGSSRKGDDGLKRFHGGVDVFADSGDTVQAMEDGNIVAILPYHHGSYAIYVKNDSGILVNYGEVEKNSWLDYGIQSGVGTNQRVQAGQPLAKIGVMSGGSSMLHLETYKGDTSTDAIRDGKMQWKTDAPAPDALLDPTRYLVRAQRAWFEDKVGVA